MMGPSRYLRRGFFQNVVVIMASSGVAQIITVGFSPLLSRLYGPDDFGFYGTFVSIAGVLGAAVTLQFSDALMLPHTEEKAAGLFWAALVSTVAITALAGVLWLLFLPGWSGLLKFSSMREWLWVVPFAALLAGVNQTLIAWCARRKAFRRAATILVGRSITANSGQAAAGVASWGGGGLIAGSLVGDAIAALGLFFWVVREDCGTLRAGARRACVVDAVREHKDFALYSAPQNLLNAISQGAPVVMLVHYFGPAIGGIYAFAIRVLQFPMNFVLSSLNQVLFQKLSEVRNQGGDLVGHFARTTCALLSISLVPAVAGFFFAPQLFGLAFGAKWVLAGKYARWLLVWLVPGFCNLPAALAGRILGQQRNLLLFDLGLLWSRIAVLVIGGIFGTALQTIVMFSITGAVFNVILILFIWNRLKQDYVSDVAFRNRRPAAGAAN